MRIHTLDYLRGLAAIGIMIYHYSNWTFGDYNSDTFLGIVGIYGVSIFYILSGLTLFLVYQKKLTLKNTPTFFVKRVFRIYPLLWLIMILSIVFLNRTLDLNTIFLNFTGLFGFFDHDNYIATGAWSIGNELVFYSFFPFLMIVGNKIKYFIEVFFIISCLIGAYFAFNLLSEEASLVAAWSIYINPFNQLFLFVGGMLIGKLIAYRKNKRLGLFLLAISLFIIYLYPVTGDQINIVNNWNRLVFSVLSFSITISFFITDVNFGKKFESLFTKLGAISYSVYLMHPVIFFGMSKFVDGNKSSVLFLTLCSFLTIIVSWFTYTFFEVKFINLGKNLIRTTHLNKNSIKT